MATFPLLKTGAVAQYPASRAMEYSTCVLRFVDGSEQRFREYPNPIRRWTIRLELLDETELAQIEEFFQAEQGRYGSFAFTDPWDGRQYPSCSLEGDLASLDFRGPARGSAVLMIRENTN